MMNSSEFNNKYDEYLEANHYGLAIDIPSVTEYLDNKFQELIKVPGFKYSQIKMKFNNSRVYCSPNSIDSGEVEKEINRLVKEYDNLNNRRILLNSIKTPDGTILISKHRHDYVGYTDKNGQHYAVDGGGEYCRRTFDKPDYEDISIYDDGTHELRRKHCLWGVNYTKEMIQLPETVYKPIMELNSEHIQAILDNGYATNPFYKELFEMELKFRKI